MCLDGPLDTLADRRVRLMATIVRRLRSYYRRRIDIPVGAAALVLDVGSGDKPHWRADILLDRHLTEAHGGQRSGSRSVSITHPMFDADAADMPFADGVFDFVVCSHMLEHVKDPAAVIGELTRVAKAGYIEVPEAASAKIVDFPSHLWWCELLDGVLVFTAKSQPFFDAGIDAYLTTSGLRERLAKMLDADLDHRVVSLRWSGTIPFEVRGTLDPGFADAAMSADAHHRGGQALASRCLTAATRLAYRRRLRRVPVRFDDVVTFDRRRNNDEHLSAQIYRCAGTRRVP